MALIAAGHKIIVKPDDWERERDLGDGRKLTLVVDERQAMGAQVKGTIHSVGKSAWKAFGPDFKGEPWASKGDRVYYSQYAGKRLQDPEDPDTVYLVMLDEDINALIIGEDRDGG